MEEELENFENKDPMIHSNTKDCQCEVCVKAKDRYVRIIDMDFFVDNLNDWD